MFEDEYCVACPICHEVMVRRERKKKMEADRKKALKAAKKVASKVQSTAAASVPKAPSKKAAKPPQESGTSLAAAAPPAARKRPVELPAPAANSVRPSAWAPPPPMPPSLPPCPEGLTLAETAEAEAAISNLFSTQRSEDLPLEMVRTATGLSDAKLDSLIAFMDNENKLMCRKGVVYLI